MATLVWNGTGREKELFTTKGAKSTKKKKGGVKLINGHSRLDNVRVSGGTRPKERADRDLSGHRPRFDYSL